MQITEVVSAIATGGARVLVVDDDEIDRARLRRLAVRVPLVGAVVDASTLDAALAAMEEAACDVVLLDLLLGAEDGTKLLARMRERHLAIPCVLLTGMQDPQVIVSAMRAGAIDYVDKNALTGERLEQALRNAIRVGTAEREVAAARAALERQVSVLGSLVELSVRVLATQDPDEALRAGVSAGVALFDARVSCALTLDGRRYEASQSPFAAAAALAARLVVTVTDRLGAHVGELVCERAAPPFDRADELAAQQLARAVVGAMEKHGLVAESRRRQREREEIVAVVSHDLRAPLQTFSFGLDALGTVDTAEAREQVRTRMTRSARQMGRLIDDLLDVSRIHDGKLSLRLGRVVAARVLAHVVEQLGPLAAERKVTLVAEPTPPSLDIRADEARLEQALGNLVTNAVRHTPGGHVTLRARADGPDLLLEVLDDGPGVPVDVREELFERLYQGENRGALGLGLYIVKGIAQAHRGSVGIDDAPERGSRFWIRLPLRAIPTASSTA